MQVLDSLASASGAKAWLVPTDVDNTNSVMEDVLNEVGRRTSKPVHHRLLSGSPRKRREMASGCRPHEEHSLCRPFAQGVLRRGKRHGITLTENIQPRMTRITRIEEQNGSSYVFNPRNPCHPRLNVFPFAKTQRF